jgi:cobalt-zinc-cadmium efflux system membrane fusion protein
MNRFLVGVCFVATTLLAAGCNDSKHTDHANDHEHAQEEAHGPHGGRLLQDGDVSAELEVYEAGTPPHFRLYFSKRGAAVPADSFEASVQLSRLGGAVGKITFRPAGEFQESVQEILEPHSFEVQVSITDNGKTHSWSFDSFEGRTTIPADVAERAGIHTEEVASRVIKATLPLRGKVVPSEHRIAHIIPRFPGMVREGHKHIGDKVEKGEVLAIVESNQSLQPFEVKSQIAGTVINGHLIVGEYVPENQWVYIVADLSEVWVDFHLPLTERESVRVGQSVSVSTGLDSGAITGNVSYIAPYADERTQSQLVRVVNPNPDERFVPGMFVTGDLVLSNEPVKAAVRRSAIQTFRAWKVVFLNVGDVYEIRPLTLGRSDDEWVEVISGIEPGARYVTENSYTVKADILKSGASHDH